jgi:hypothetical protein
MAASYSSRPSLTELVKAFLLTPGSERVLIAISAFTTVSVL